MGCNQSTEQKPQQQQQQATDTSPTVIGPINDSPRAKPKLVKYRTLLTGQTIFDAPSKATSKANSRCTSRASVKSEDGSPLDATIPLDSQVLRQGDGAQDASPQTACSPSAQGRDCHFAAQMASQAGGVPLEDMIFATKLASLAYAGERDGAQGTEARQPLVRAAVQAAVGGGEEAAEKPLKDLAASLGLRLGRTFSREGPVDVRGFVAHNDAQADVLLALSGCICGGQADSLGAVGTAEFGPLAERQGTFSFMDCCNAFASCTERAPSVHEGYYAGFQSIVPELYADVLSLLKSKRPVRLVVTGHGIGGAVATGALAYILKEVDIASSPHCVLFVSTGQPKFGDGAFRSWLEDEVTRLAAVGKCKFVPMPRAAALLLGPPHVVTAARFASLTGRMTDDDMFSSDLSDDELRERLGHVAVPTLVAVSADDEYVPRSVDARALAARMADAMAASPLGRVEQLVIEEGGHGLRRGGGAGAFVEAAAAFLGRLDAGPRLTWERGLARGLLEQAKEMVEGRPLMVGVAGMPGSGKTTAASALERLLGPSCLVVPMDGFHLPMASLRARPDAAAAIYRRGAPDTFDPAALRECLHKIRSPDGPNELTLPGFDHAIGDPTLGVTFDRRVHRIVLVEGLYLLHDADNWEGTAEAFDRTVYVDADIEECVARVKERNKVIPGYTAEEIARRTEEVDRANAMIVQRSAPRADIRSSSAA